MRGRRQGALTGRSPAEWGVRIVLALLAAAAGFLAITNSLASVIGKAGPESAHALAPGNGVITGALARQRFTLNPDPAVDSEPAQLARTALRQDPTSVDALAVLGLQAQLRNDTEAARQVFSYSHSLSRRELRSQIWAIEEAVTRGDITGALEQYDIALRTSRSARGLLFPVLTSALAEPLVRSALLELLATEPAWGEAFVDFAARRSLDPQVAIQFFREGEGVDLPFDEADQMGLVDALVALSRPEEAWAYYASVRPDADQRSSRDATFERVDAPASVFDWVALDNSGAVGSLQRGAGGGFLDFWAPATVGGTVLRQMQALLPGEYRLEGHSIGLEQIGGAQPYWVLTCPGGREIDRVSVANSAENNGLFSGTFTVPSGCPVQTLSFVIRPSDGVGGVSGQIDRVQLTPAE